VADPVLCELIIGSMNLIGGPIKVGKIIDLKGVLELDVIEGAQTRAKVSNTQFKKAVGSLVDRKVIGRIRTTSDHSMADTTSITLWLRPPLAV
jgi:hypothetical protein